MPPGVRREAHRTLLNWMGCAVGRSRHETLDAALGALTPFSGPPQASVLGRRERLDVLHAALMNGISSHVFDFDDTHLRTVIHPAGPVVSGLLALAEHRPMSGADFMHALVLGVEVECRIGNAVYPAQEHQVRARITLRRGRVVTQFVEHVVGSLERPMSDRDLEAKVLDLMEGVLPDAQARALVDLCWKADTLPNAAALAAAAAARA